MSFERMIDDVKVCDCGEGTITYVNEMDDWNRTQRWKEFQCLHCEKEHEKIIQQQNSDREQRDLLLRQAQDIAINRYLEKWLKHFEGRNKKQVWEMLVTGPSHPALGTFYKHVRETGLEKKLTYWLKNNIIDSLKLLGIQDEEIVQLLEERDDIPEHRERHPYQ